MITMSKCIGQTLLWKSLWDDPQRSNTFVLEADAGRVASLDVTGSWRALSGSGQCAEGQWMFDLKRMHPGFFMVSSAGTEYATFDHIQNRLTFHDGRRVHASGGACPYFANEIGSLIRYRPRFWYGGYETEVTLDDLARGVPDLGLMVLLGQFLVVYEARKLDDTD
jgi:hypothetical protein